MESGIYKIKNKINGKTYVGQSKNVKSRIYQHKKQLKENKHYNSYLQSSFNKHGFDSFEFESIERCEESSLNEREVFWIKHLDSFNSGYNLTNGGNCRVYNCADYAFENVETGEIVVGKNILDFCLKYNIPKSVNSHLSEVARGRTKRNTCHGWRRLGTKHPVNRMKSFKLKHSNGEVYEGSNITKFCKEKNINRSNIIAMMKGRQKTSYGWTLFSKQ